MVLGDVRLAWIVTWQMSGCEDGDTDDGEPKLSILNSNPYVITRSREE